MLKQATESDEFRVGGREVYWLSHLRMSHSDFSGAKLEKILGMPATLRNVNTVRRLAAKLAPGAAGEQRGGTRALK